jgi:hypothetical protein
MKRSELKKIIEESLSEDTARKETQEHIDTVGRNLDVVVDDLKLRKEVHDKSKLEEPEFSTFVEFTPKLKGATYGSEEYDKFLSDMKPALDHHYANNSYHHEDGVNGMTLVDLLEMIADWHAVTQCHDDGDIKKSIELNKERFNLSDQLCDILRNTAELFEIEDND